MWADVRRRVNLRGRGDNGGRMNAAGKFGFGEKHCERLGESNARIFHADDNFPGRRRIFPGDDGGGRTIFGGGKKLVGFSKSKVAKFCGVGAGKAGERGICIAEDFTGEQFCDFSSGKCH